MAQKTGAIRRPFSEEGKTIKIAPLSWPRDIDACQDGQPTSGLNERDWLAKNGPGQASRGNGFQENHQRRESRRQTAKGDREQP